MPASCWVLELHQQATLTRCRLRGRRFTACDWVRGAVPEPADSTLGLHAMVGGKQGEA